MTAPEDHCVSEPADGGTASRPAKNVIRAGGGELSSAAISFSVRGLESSPPLGFYYGTNRYIMQDV